MPKVAFIDLTFNWPPVGGCWIDTFHILTGLQDSGIEVRLFVPRFETYYPRGTIKTDLPFPVTLIPFNRLTYNFVNVRRRFQAVVKEFEPDLVFIGDGYAMKAHLLDIYDPARTILRFYAYEILCTNLHYYRYHENRICEYGFLDDPDECRRCWFRRVPSWVRALQILVGWPERHPVLHFSQEAIAARAFTKQYWTRLKENLQRLGCAIVYNSFIASFLRPYVEDVRVIPSGVDTEKFREPDSISLADGSPGRPVRVFLPGRANDPLKGLDTLREAACMLREKGIELEVHYTAAMEGPRPEPWMVNHHWVAHDELPALYRDMDIVVVPSTWVEPFGITAVEGMSAGLPVVASRIGGLAESVVHGRTGCHFEAGRADDLANRLESLIRSPKGRAILGAQGSRRARDVFDWKKIVERHYLPLVSELIEKSTRN